MNHRQYSKVPIEMQLEERKKRKVGGVLSRGIFKSTVDFGRLYFFSLYLIGNHDRINTANLANVCQAVFLEF